MDEACLTPNFHHMMQRGVHFARAYTPSQLCSPARASLMTGMLPHNHGVLQVEHCVDDDQSVLRSQHPHWAQRLVDQGYRTGYFGKWHIERSGRLEQYGWQENGAETKVVIRPGMGDSGEGSLVRDHLLRRYQTEPAGYRPYLHYGLTDVEPENRTFGRVTERALSYLDEVLNDGAPWATCVSFSEPNEPVVCHTSSFQHLFETLDLPGNLEDPMSNAPGLYRRAQRVYAGMSERQWREARACYFGLVHEIDGMLGHLLDRIDAAGVLDDTLVVVVSDHGRYVGAHGMDAHNIVAFEEVFGIPLVVAGPGVRPGRGSIARVGLHDLCPTVLELTGVEPITAHGPIDVALWDITAKKAGMPLYQLIGGYRDRFKAYATCPTHEGPEGYVAEAQRAAARGFKAYKLHPPGDADLDIQCCRAVRDAMGPDFTLMSDPVGAYDFEDAVRVGRALEKLNYFWYEEPLFDYEIHNYVRLTQMLDIPVAGVEWAAGRYHLAAEYITRGAVDIVRSDVSWKGGVTGYLKTAHLCEAFGLNCEIHLGIHSVLNLANLHAACGVKNCRFLELTCDIDNFAMTPAMTVDEEGYVHVPSAPGLGMELDWDLIEDKTVRVV